MTVYKLAGQGLSQTDRATIKTTLDLASGLELSEWQQSELADAQALILDLDNEAGARCWQSVSEATEIELPVILISKESVPSARATVLLHPPLSYPPLLNALKQAEHKLIELARKPPLSGFGDFSCDTSPPHREPNPVVAVMESELVADLVSPSDTLEMTEQEAALTQPQDDETLRSAEVLRSERTFSVVASDPIITQELDFSDTESLPELSSEPDPSITLAPESANISSPASEDSAEIITLRDNASFEPPDLDNSNYASRLPTNVVNLNSSVATQQEDAVSTVPEPIDTDREETEPWVEPESLQTPRPKNPPTTTITYPLSMSAIMRPARMYYPSTRLLGLIRLVMSEGRSKEIYTAGFPPIQIFPISKSFIYRGQIDESDELFQKPLFEFDVRDINKSAPPELQGPNAPKPISILLYAAALFGSEGKYCQHAPPHGKIKLRNKPDFEQLPHSEDHLKLADYLLQNSADLLSIAADTGCDLDDVVNFHNACCELHLLKHTESSNPEKTEASCPYFQQDHEVAEKKITFFGRLKQKFTESED